MRVGAGAAWRLHSGVCTGSYAKGEAVRPGRLSAVVQLAGRDPGLWPARPASCSPHYAWCLCLRLSPGTCSRRGCPTSTPSSPPSGSGSRLGKKTGTSGRSSTSTASPRYGHAPVTFLRGLQLRLSGPWPHLPGDLLRPFSWASETGVWLRRPRGPAGSVTRQTGAAASAPRVECLGLWWERRPTPVLGTLCLTRGPARGTRPSAA